MVITRISLLYGLAKETQKTMNATKDERNRVEAREVIVRDQSGVVVKKFEGSFFSPIVLVQENGRTMITQSGLVWDTAYIPSVGESIETN